MKSQSKNEKYKVHYDYNRNSACLRFYLFYKQQNYEEKNKNNKKKPCT